MRPLIRWACSVRTRCASIARPGLGRDPNPLRRRSDRWEAAAGLSALVIVLVSIPLAVLVSVGLWRHEGMIAAEQVASRHLISVTVVADGHQQGWGTVSRSVTVQWRDPQGITRTAPMVVGGGVKDGDSLPSWTDDRGGLTNPPMNRTDVFSYAVGTGVAVVMAAMLLAVLAYGLLRRRLDAVRDRSWDESWLRFDQTRPQGRKR
jgi:hypothetical protein